MAAASAVRILIADSQPLFREAVKAVVEGQPDLRVISLAGDGVQAVADAERDRPDLAVLDVKLPNCDGIRAARLIGERVPECRVLMLADGDDEATLIASVEAGARGFLTRESPLSELIEGLRTIHRGEMLIPNRLLASLVSGLIRRRREQDEGLRRASGLTRREREVLGLVAEGCDKDAIAQVLVISPETVRTHIQNVLAKLGLHSRLEAASFVIRNGLLPELAEADGSRSERVSVP